MKHIRSRLSVLAASEASAINEYEFRNMSEVNTYLDAIEEQHNKSVKLLQKFTASVIVAADDEDDDSPKAKKISLLNPGMGDYQRDPAVRIRQLQVKRPGAQKESVKIKPTELKGLAENFVVAQDIANQINKLNTLRVLIRNDFAGDKQLKSTLSHVDALEKKALDSLAKAQAFMAAVAQKHLPDSVNTTFKGITGPVLRELKGRYKTATQQIHATAFNNPTDGQIIQFTKYLSLTNLKNDKGQVYPKFFIVLYCCIDASGTHRYYVDTNTRYEVPSKDSLDDPSRGAYFTKSKEGLRLLHTAMKVDESLDILNKGDIPLNKSDINKLGTSIKNTIKSVVEDEKEGTIRFVLEKSVDSEQKAQNVVKVILNDVSGLTTNQVAHEKIKTKVGKTKGGAYSITITFAGAIPRNTKKYRDDKEVLNKLRHDLGLEDDEVRRISRVLRSRFVVED